MKKFVIGLITGLALAGLAGLVLLFSLARVSEKAPAVQARSTLVLNLQGSFPERPQMQLPFPAFESRTPVTVHQVWSLLRAAAEDPKIEAAVLTPGSLGVGWGKLQEIRAGLMKFKESGKPLVAYLHRPGTAEYYLASAADKIYMAREDTLNLKGLRVEAMYVKAGLDKVGVKVEIESAGRYKDAGDMFTQDTMSPATREVLNSLLDELYEHLLAAVGESRGLSPDQVRAILDEGPFLAPQAMEKGLIDILQYEDQMYEGLREETGHKTTVKISHRSYARAVAGQPAATGNKQIALVVGSGTILAGSGDTGFGEDDGIWSRSFIKLLRQVRENDKVIGVILRVDSPGGDAIASDEILREVKLLSEEKPMVISMSDVAASGGYYISMTGDPVVAYPNTFTGSIGVIYGKLNLRGLYDKMGVRKEILKRGRFADIDSDYTPLEGEARDKLREGITAVYDTFLGVVAEGRNRPLEEIEPLAQGRVWLGEQARENGLVDELGGLDEAIAILKEEAGIPAEEQVHLVPFPQARSFWEFLLDQDGESVVRGALGQFSGRIKLPQLPEPGIWRMMPYRLEVK